MAGQWRGAGAAVKDVTTASFKADVLNASARQPVLVDFWAPWCGPCKQLAPVLEKAVADSKGKVTLVKMNIDEHPQIAGQLGIQSIPAVIAFDKGQPVDGFMGAVPESQVRGFIERLVGPLAAAPMRLIVEAEAAAAAGARPEGAAALYARVLDRGRDQRQGDRRPRATACRSRRSRPGQGGAVDGAPPPPARTPIRRSPPRSPPCSRPSRPRRSAISAAGAALAADPDDHQARFDLAVALNANGERDGAADRLLEIVKRDRRLERRRGAQAACCNCSKPGV